MPKQFYLKSYHIILKFYYISEEVFIIGVGGVIFKLEGKGYYDRENTRREESKYLECEIRKLGRIAIAAYIFKPPMEKFKIRR